MLRRQFLQLISDLRAELELASDPAVGVSDYSTLKVKINRVYETLYADYDWPHLMRTFDAIPLQAGQRYYDVPQDLDFDRIEEVVTWWGGIPTPVERGISISDYTPGMNSEAGDRLDPMLKWDVRYDEAGDKENIEAFPIPASNDNTLQFRGIQKFKPLVNDADICRLDDKMVVLFAAAELAPAKSGNKQLFVQAGTKRMMQVRGNAKTAAKRTYIGGSEAPSKPRGVVLRVGR